jgi:hypothetical protein
MGQVSLNILVSAYAVVSAISIGILFKMCTALHDMLKKQIEFNDEVIRGFTLTREVLSK